MEVAYAIRLVEMGRKSVVVCISFLLSTLILLSPYVTISGVQAQTVSTVVTTKSITPACALPGQTMTVKINISVTGGGGGVGGLAPIQASLVIDRTGSMWGNKFEDAKAAAKAFIGVQHTDDLAEVIFFSETSAVTIGFTVTDTPGRTALNHAIDTAPSPYGYTNLYGAFERSVNEITSKGQSGFKRAILLMTDGRPNIGITTSSKFVQLSQSAVSVGAVVYTVGLGGPGVQDPVNGTLLQTIADAGKGKYFFAPDSADLDDIYLEIAQELEGAPARNVHVTEQLPGSIVTYNNDATQPPNSTSGGNIFWQIPLITAGTSWGVTFTVTTQSRVAVVQSLSPTQIIYDRGEQIGIRIDLGPGMAVREVAITSIGASATTATKGDVLKYNATVVNRGTVLENVPVALFANSSRIGTTSVSLSPGDTKVVQFSWNTSNYNTGNYNVSIIADPDRSITCNDITGAAKAVSLVLNPQSEGSILPLFLLILIPMAIIPIAAAAILGRRRGYAWGTPAAARRVTPGGMVCPRCFSPLTHNPTYQKYYCLVCDRYL